MSKSQIIYENWNLFWNAFGAIGTTIGSVVTAIAVIIAVKQYMQPLNKHIKVEFSSAVTIGSLNIELYGISIKNMGVRQVIIDSINIHGNKKTLWLNNMMAKQINDFQFPIKIEPEQCVTVYFIADQFREELSNAVNNNTIKKRKKLIVFATDSFNEKYTCNTKIRISKLINWHNH